MVEDIEEWRECFHGLYEVSSLGNVRRKAPARGTNAGRLLKPKTMPKGYLAVRLTNRYVQRQLLVARLVAEAFLGPRPDGLQVNHKNGVKGDNRVGNLEYVTASENMRHAYANGLR